MTDSPLLFTADDLFNTNLVTVLEVTIVDRRSSTGAKQVVTLASTQLMTKFVAREFFIICIENGNYAVDDVTGNENLDDGAFTIRISNAFDDPDGYGTMSSHYIFKSTAKSLREILDYIREMQLWVFA